MRPGDICIFIASFAFESLAARGGEGRWEVAGGVCGGGGHPAAIMASAHRVTQSASGLAEVLTLSSRTLGRICHSPLSKCFRPNLAR